jgi:putative flavoprotein involved in K+ transport
MSERTEVAVIGGGQAGLAAGYYLQQSQVPFVILDAEARIGAAWRNRWETLELFTAAGYSALPELNFPGDPEHFPGKDEVADYLERYAQTFELPIRLGTRATSLIRTDGRYRIETSTGSYETDQVIVSTGAYQRPYVPALAEKLDPALTQMHSADYRDPQQLKERDVLVVGAANSGAQIATDLATSHQVRLAQGSRLPRLPRTLLGRSLHWWGDHLGLFTAPLEGSLRGRTQRGDLLVGPSLRHIARRHGIELKPRAVDGQGRTVRFEDGSALEVQTIIWATGYRPDYSWIDVPIFDERGLPIHERGVTRADGLYFLGMHRQYSRGSSLIAWVKHDARFIVERVGGVRAKAPVPEEGLEPPTRGL